MFRSTAVPLAAALLLFSAGLTELRAQIQDQGQAPGQQAPTSAPERFRELYEAEWEFRLRESPRLATAVGDRRFNHLLARQRPEDIERRTRYWKGVLSELEQIDRDALAADDQTNYAIFYRQIKSFIDNVENQGYLIPFTSDWGFYSGLARLPAEVPLVTLEDYNNYLDRLAMVPLVIDDNIALMRRGIEVGMTQPRVILAGRDKAISTHVVDEVSASVFYAPLKKMPESIDEIRRTQLEARAGALIGEQVIPAFARLLEFFNGEYTDGARETLGASEFPNGARYYADQISYYTTLDLTAEQIHDIGLKEVARIRSEMEAIITQLEFEGSFADFLQFLRTDPQFYAESPRELMMVASYYAKKMDGALPRFFKTLPRQPYGVEPVPADLAPFFTGGRYVGAPISSTRPGLYWVNTYNLASRTLYTIPALTLHEAAPGHHLQAALAKEQGEQPPFRRSDYISAYGEGWGLYAEFLGIEAGIYETPYDHFGRLTYEMWRACRLVVDTGVHNLGWTRQQALDYLAGNTALSTHEVTTEIDRYISWPGQALAYKLGELRIRALRDRATEALGAAFDLREFHDVVLAQGSVPLPILESAVDQYIKEAAE
ncbi:MAG: DUF885 domain-containing protein [Pseudomonadota bacterium]